MVLPVEYVIEGDKAYKERDYLRAAESYRDAASAYTLMGDILTAAKMLNNSSVAYLLAGEGQLALDITEGTADIFADTNNTLLQAMAIGNRAAALDKLERVDEAEKVYLQSARLLREIGAMELHLQVMRSLSVMQLRLGRRLEAFVSMYTGVNAIDHPSPQQRLLKALMQIPFRLFN